MTLHNCWGTFSKQQLAHADKFAYLTYAYGDTYGFAMPDYELTALGSASFKTHYPEISQLEVPTNHRR